MRAWGLNRQKSASRVKNRNFMAIYLNCTACACKGILMHCVIVSIDLSSL